MKSFILFLISVVFSCCAPTLLAAEKEKPAPSKLEHFPEDCSQSKHPQFCEAHKKAMEACKGKSQEEHRDCMEDAMINAKYDCGKAPHPEQCEAARKAAELCKGKKGQERRKCVHDNIGKTIDCSKAANPQRCEALKKVHEACKDKEGDERRKCIDANRPKPEKK